MESSGFRVWFQVDSRRCKGNMQGPPEFRVQGLGFVGFWSTP